MQGNKKKLDLWVCKMCGGTEFSTAYSEGMTWDGTAKIFRICSKCKHSVLIGIRKSYINDAGESTMGRFMYDKKEY